MTFTQTRTHQLLLADGGLGEVLLRHVQVVQTLQVPNLHERERTDTHMDQKTATPIGDCQAANNAQARVSQEQHIRPARTYGTLPNPQSSDE